MPTPRTPTELYAEIATQLASAQPGGITAQQLRTVTDDIVASTTAGRVNVAMFGAVGDGEANDRDAIRSAIAFCKSTGTALEANAGETYYLGTFPDAGEAKFTIDFDGFTFNPNNCKFTATYNSYAGLWSTVLQRVFEIVDANNVVIGDFQVEADAVERTTGASGIVAVLVNSTAANARNLKLGSIVGTKLLSVLSAVSADPANIRYRGIRFNQLLNEAGYYTLNCANNGDDISGVIHTNNGVRSYFVYGVSAHQVKVFSTNHFKFTDILVKRYEYDTFNLHIEYDCPSDVSSDAAISIEHQNAGDNGTIRDVYLDFRVVKSNAANPTLNFCSFDAGGSIRATTASVTDNIYVRGSTNSTTPTVIGSSLTGTNGLNLSRLFIPKSLLLGLGTFSRYIVHDSQQRMVARSNAADGMAIKFNLSGLAAVPIYGTLTVWGANDPSSTATSEYILRTYLVAFEVNSNGDQGLLTSTTIATQTAGGLGPTITFPAQVGTFNLEIDVSNYVHANRQCAATFELFRIN